jgi:raffinose/stachyose/melibiose transport system permease protein
MKIKVPFKIGSAVLQVCLIGFAILQIYPLVWLGLFSLKDNSEIFGGNIAGLPEKFRWENYNNAFSQGNVMQYLRNSVLVTGVTIAAVILLSAMTSYAITRMQWRLSSFVLNLILIGLMVPIHATLLPLFHVLKNLKLLNSFLSLMIPYVAFGIPLALVIFNGFIQGIPKELEEAATIDGCNIYKIFGKIILPLLKPVIATIAILTFISSWNELMFAVTFINKQEFKTLTVGIMGMVGSYVTKWGPIGAGLMIATLPTILIYVLLSKQVQESIAAGAIKG